MLQIYETIMILKQATTFEFTTVTPILTYIVMGWVLC